MIFNKFILRALLYVFCDSICLVNLQWFNDNLNFYQVYSILVSVLVLTIFIERLFIGVTFYFQLPIGNIIFLIVGFYLPLPFIFENETLKFLSNWNKNYLVYSSIIYGNIGLHAVLLGYTFVKMFSLKIKLFKGNFLFYKNKINWLFMLSISAILLLILTGNYGITEQQSEGSENYVTIFSSIVQFSNFGLIFLTFYHNDKKVFIFLVTFGFFILGLLSGGKENAILPLLMVGITDLFVNRTIPLQIIMVGLTLVYASFIIVTSFRNVYLKEGRKELSSIQDLTSTYVESATKGSSNKYNHYKLTTAQQMINRFNYVPAFSKSIKYVEKNGFGLPYDSDPFHIILSPFYAFVPRFIFPFKPFSNFGEFMSSYVYGYGKKSTYAIGVSQIGYSFIWKGVPGIIFLMFFVGVFQGIIFKVFYSTFTPIYIFLFISNIYVSDAIWVYFATFIRYFTLMILIYYLIGTKRILSNI